MTRALTILGLAIPGAAGAFAIAWWWTWNGIEHAIRRAMRANRWRISRRGARVL